MSAGVEKLGRKTFSSAVVMLVGETIAGFVSVQRRRRSLIRAQGWRAATTLGSKQKAKPTLKALGLCDINPFRVERMMVDFSQGCRCAPTTGLELANAFGVHQSLPSDGECHVCRC